MEGFTMRSSKLPSIGTTIFTKMSALAQQYGALNMSQGFPDFDPPPALQAEVSNAMARGHNQYAPMAGNLQLRHWVHEDVLSRTGASFDAEQEITVGAGASSLIFATIQALIHPGDCVMVLTPCYDLYEPAVKLAGGSLIAVPLKEKDHHLDLAAIQAAWNERIRLLIVNVPNNPTGSTWTRDELSDLGEFIKDSSALVLSDEVYHPMCYDSAGPLSVAHEPNLRDRCVIAASFGKILHCTGWKIGYVCAQSEIMREIRKVHQYDVFSTGAPFQAGIASFLCSDDGRQHMDQLSNFYREKRDRLLQGLAGSRWEFSPAEGGYFQILSYRSFSKLSDMEATETWCKKPNGIALIPLTPFYPEGSAPENLNSVRVCFAKENDTLDQGIERLLNLSNP